MCTDQPFAAGTDYKTATVLCKALTVCLSELPRDTITHTCLVQGERTGERGTRQVHVKHAALGNAPGQVLADVTARGGRGVMPSRVYLLLFPPAPGVRLRIALCDRLLLGESRWFCQASTDNNTLAARQLVLRQ